MRARRGDIPSASHGKSRDSHAAVPVYCNRLDRFYSRYSYMLPHDARNISIVT